MWTFLKKLHLTFFGLSVVLGIVLFFIFLGSMSSSDELEDRSVLKITLDQRLVEQAAGAPIGSDLNIPINMFEPKFGVLNLVEAIKKAKNDPQISSIFLELRMINGGLGATEEIRNALKDFKSSDKKIIAYGDFFDEKAYYLASVADSVYLTHEGLVEFNGFVAEINFYKNLLNSIGVEPKVFRVGKFKGAVEPFMRDSISNENRLQITSFLNSLHKTMLTQIGESRGVTFETLKDISDNLKARNAYQAKELGLIDDVIYYDEVVSVIRKVSGIKDTEEVNYVNAESYWTLPEGISLGEEVAVIIADGEIGMGNNQEDVIGGNGMAKLIREARLDPNVGAIVLRINSPGGSALASDLMWREIYKASEAKPIVASMSDMAASGGYYMAMACDTIVAHESTITGSIGVFGMMFNAQELIKGKLGVHTDRVKTGKFSDLGTPTRAMTPEDSAIIQAEVNTIYDAFITKAAQGRGMTKEALGNVASGRVWSGAMALENGLVDVIGGLDDAISIAKEMAGKKDLTTVYYPKINSLFGTIENGYKATITPVEIKELQESELYQYYKNISKLNKLQGVQARSPYDLIIK